MSVELADEVAELVGGAASLGVTLTEAQALRALKLLDELAEWNQRFNLTGITERAAMRTAHLLDSWSAFPDLAGTRIADVGTGAGFPGLPLALVAPAQHFTLIDSTGKKVRFVEHAAAVMGLTNVTPLQARTESLHPKPPFDTVLARAFAPLPLLLQSVAGLCGPRTRLVALKGRYPSDELEALPRGWRLLRSRPVSIPGLDAQRHILTLSPPGA